MMHRDETRPSLSRWIKYEPSAGLCLVSVFGLHDAVQNPAFEMSVILIFEKRLQGRNLKEKHTSGSS